MLWFDIYKTGPDESGIIKNDKLILPLLCCLVDITSY